MEENYTPLLEDSDDGRHLPEVENFNFEKKSKIRLFFESLAQGVSDTSEAIDDSYSIFSAIASEGFHIIKFPFLIMASFLVLTYNIAKNHKRKLKNPYVDKRQLADMCSKIITSEQIKSWQAKLDMIENKDINLEELLYENNFDKIFEKIMSSHHEIGLVNNHPDNEMFKQQCEIVRQQLSHKLRDVAKKLNASGIQAKIWSLYEQHNWAVDKKNSRWDKLKSFLFLIRDNYKTVLRGVALAATFGALLLLAIGPAIMAMFPWNILLIVGLTIFFVGFHLLYKHYFKHKLKKMSQTVNSVVEIVYDRGQLISLLVESKVTKYNLNQIIPAGKQAQENDNQMLENEVEIVENIEHVDFQYLKSKPSKMHYFMRFLLPALLAATAGYGIGATLLQLFLIGGVGAPILPFVFLGVGFSVIYIIHRLWLSYKEYREDRDYLQTLTALITTDKINSWNDKRKLMSMSGFEFCEQNNSSNNLVKSKTAEELVQILLNAYERLQSAREQAGNSKSDEVFRSVDSYIINFIPLQIATIKTPAIAESLRTIHCQKLTQRFDEEMIDQHSAKKIKQMASQAYQFMLRFLKPVSEGTAFGLGLSAILIIFLHAAFVFLSFSVIVAMLVLSAVVGIGITVSRQVLKQSRKQYHEELKATENIIKDKELLMDIYLDIEYTRYQIEKIQEGKGAESSVVDDRRKIFSNGKCPSYVDFTQQGLFRMEKKPSDGARNGPKNTVKVRPNGL